MYPKAHIKGYHRRKKVLYLSAGEERLYLLWPNLVDFVYKLWPGALGAGPGLEFLLSGALWGRKMNQYEKEKE